MNYRKADFQNKITISREELQIRTFQFKLKEFSNYCFNCSNHRWVPDDRGQQRQYIPPRKGWWLWAARPEHNKRKCLSCGAKWLEKIGDFKIHDH